MPISTISPAEAVDQGVRAAYEAEGYLNPDGSRDLTKVRERVAQILCSEKVLSQGERAVKATTRAAMVEQVFPSLPGPESWDDERDPQLAQAVWKKIDSFLWAECSPSAKSAVQRLVGITMGNGYVLCRTQVTKDRVSATYVTDDVACIERDFVRAAAESLETKIKSVLADTEMLILRQPANGRRWSRGFESRMKAQLASARDQLALALTAASENIADEGDEE